MYTEFYGFRALPFSIAPDPQFLYPSEGHQEALAHLHYALSDQGGLVCLTGEVGTGKTMLCRHFIEQLPDNVQCAYVFNPQLGASELLLAICRELGFIDANQGYDEPLAQLFDRLYQGLLQCYGEGKRVICLIDEAQTIPLPVLEQVRLLTNLETEQHKLMTLILVGQPELNEVLSRHDMRQLNQRITARSHLNTLSYAQVQAYLNFRLQCVGGSGDVFSHQAVRLLWKASGGTPRLLNSMADRALLGGYARSQKRIGASIANSAIREVLGHTRPSQTLAYTGLLASLMLALGVFLWLWPQALPNAWREYVAHDDATLVDAPNIASNSTLQAIPQAMVSADSSANSLPSAQAHIEPPRTDQSGIDQPQATALTPDQRALHMLLAAYKVKADNDPDTPLTCEAWAHERFECLKVRWSSKDLLALERPVVMIGYNGLQRLTQNNANGYLGIAFLLWQPPEGYDGVVRVGQTSKVVPWVREQLSALYPDAFINDSLANKAATDQTVTATKQVPTWVSQMDTSNWQRISPKDAATSTGAAVQDHATEQQARTQARTQVQAITQPAIQAPDDYDATLAQVVQRFQVQMGLRADKILGPQTLMAISQRAMQTANEQTADEKEGR